MTMNRLVYIRGAADNKGAHDMLNRGPRSSIIAALLLAASLVSTSWGRANERAVEFNIPPQALGSALLIFAKQADVQVSVSTTAIADMKTPGVVGTFTPSVALTKLLVETDLGFSTVGDRTFAVLQMQSTRASAMPNVANASSFWSSDVPRGTVRLAQIDANGRVDATQDAVAAKAGDKDPQELLGEVTVTGTHIRGIQNNTAPVTIYDREEIDSRGYLSTQEFIRSLPQNFKGGDSGASEDGILSTANGLNNLESASGVNLRGLGTSSTLVLLNGHRIPPSAFGAAVDVSMIPLTAIDRVEVLTDGASAIYGSDAVGGVVNFVLRKDYDGAETEMQAGGVTSGDRRQYVVGQTLGQTWNGGSGLLSLQYDDASALGSHERSFTASLERPNDLYPSTAQFSGILNGRQQLAKNVDASADVAYGHEVARRDYTSPGQSQSSDTTTEFVSANGGVGWVPFGSWQFDVSGLYSEVETSQDVEFEPSLPGYMNGTLFIRNTFLLREADLVADGSLFPIPGGDVKAALGGSYRTEAFSSRSPWAQIERLFDRDVWAVFGEFQVPLISDANSLPFMRHLDFSLSVRHDHYSDFGETTNPKFGLFWSVSDSLGLRAAYGTSFHAPDASQQTLNNLSRFVFNFPFALPTGGEGPVLVTTGSPELQPEESQNLSVGLDYRPASVPGLRLSLNYFDIIYSDRLVTTPFDTSALLTPDVYGPLITQFSSDVEAAAYLAGLIAQGFQFDDFTGTGTTGILYAYTFALTNASRVHQNGLDAGVEYSIRSGANEFDFRVAATLIDEIKTGFCATCTSTDLVNEYGQPLRLRARADFGWARGAWRLNSAVNYANSYRDITVTPPGSIESHATVDVSARYSPSALEGVTAGINVTNLFDADPPRTASGLAFGGIRYDIANADPLGRIVSLEVRKSW